MTGERLLAFEPADLVTLGITDPAVQQTLYDEIRMLIERAEGSAWPLRHWSPRKLMHSPRKGWRGRARFGSGRRASFSSSSSSANLGAGGPHSVGVRARALAVLDDSKLTFPALIQLNLCLLNPFSRALEISTASTLAVKPTLFREEIRQLVPMVRAAVTGRYHLVTFSLWLYHNSGRTYARMDPGRGWSFRDFVKVALELVDLHDAGATAAPVLSEVLYRELSDTARFQRYQNQALQLMVFPNAPTTLDDYFKAPPEPGG